MPAKWDDAEEKLLLLLLFHQADKKSVKPDIDAVLAAWPTDPSSPGFASVRTRESISKRINSLRREAAAAAGGGDAAASASAAPKPARRRAQGPIKRLKSEDQTTPVDDESAEAVDNAPTGPAPTTVAQTPRKSAAKKDSAKSNMRIKIEGDADVVAATPATALPATATGLPSPPSTAGANGRKRKRSPTTTNGDDSSSDEAVSTEAVDDSAIDAAGPSSPTPAAKKVRTSSTRAAKVQEGTYAQLDGPDSSDDDDKLMAGVNATAGAKWNMVLAQRKRAKQRAKVIRDDSDGDWAESDF